MAIEGLKDNHVSAERQQQDQSSQQSQLCVKNCGFFANGARTLNMCSKCYKHAMQETNATPSSGASEPSSSRTSAAQVSEPTSVSRMESSMPVVDSCTVDCFPVTSLTPAKRPADAFHATAPAVPTSQPPSTSSPLSEAMLSSKQAASVDAQDNVGKPPAHLSAPSSSSLRCHVCRKRVGLTGFSCRCQGLFCSVHRYSDRHECSFDYKAAGREAIAKASPVVKADKVQRF